MGNSWTICIKILLLDSSMYNETQLNLAWKIHIEFN